MTSNKVNPFSIDHIVVNVDHYYQTNQEFIKKVNDIGLPYNPNNGKGTKGFKASNIWIGNEYFEFIHVKTAEGGGWINEWVNRYNSGHRGVIGLFLKTENITDTVNEFTKYGITDPERIVFPLFLNLIKISSKWQNAYLPFFKKSPFQLGFQQIDNDKVEKNFRKRMRPNSEDNGFTGIKTVKYFGPFDSEEFNQLKEAFICIEIEREHLIIPLLNNQAIHLYISNNIRTEVEISSDNRTISSLEIENLKILSESY